jgi:hypothetical protein
MLHCQVGFEFLGIRYLVLNCAVVVRATTVRASTFFAVGFDVVVTELADLISTGTWPEVLVRQVELFDAEGAELIVIVDDGVNLLATGHDRGEDGVNGESDLGISTPAPNENPGCRKEIETRTRLRCQKKSKNGESREEITREEKET